MKFLWVFLVVFLIIIKKNVPLSLYSFQDSEVTHQEAKVFLIYFQIYFS